MKMKVTMEVEFEAREGQTENVLERALSRAVVALIVAIERGDFSEASTGIKDSSVRTFIRDKQILHGG
jgi:hypothetical protein